GKQPSAAAAEAAAAPQRQGTTPPARRPSTVGVATAAGQHATEAEAKASCPGDTVVWVNLNSKIYHYSSGKTYGHTKSGTYMCERDTALAGYRRPRNDKHPPNDSPPLRRAPAAPPSTPTSRRPPAAPV